MRLGGSAASRQRQKSDSERLDETGRGQRGRQGQHGSANGEQKKDDRLRRSSEAEQERLKRQPLTCKAVERRQAGNRHRADEEARPGPGHPTQQPPELFDLSGAGRHRHASRSKEQESLEDRVIHHVVQACRNAD